MQTAPSKTLPIFATLLTFVPIVCSHAGSTGFEKSEGFLPNTDILANGGWTASAAGVARVSDEFAGKGIQSLEILTSDKDQAVKSDFSSVKGGIVFVDFAIRPTADGTTAPSGIVDANGAVIGFVKKQDKGSVVTVVSPASPDGASNSIDTGVIFPLDEQGRAADWIRITIREDLTAQKWDLFLDGKLTLVDEPLNTSTLAKANAGSLAIYSSPAGSTFVDDVSISGANPLFTDGDRDGIPDAEEKARGGNPFVDDRKVQNAHGVSNLSEFLAESSEPSSASVSGQSIIYVDNVIGSDTNSGRLSYQASGEGPKGTLNAAVQKAGGRTILAVAASNKPYQFDSPKGGFAKDISIYPLGNIQIGPVVK